MARQFSIPLVTLQARTYGPFTVDGRQLGDVGVRIEVRRGEDGTWPLTPADPILTVLIEYRYSGVWHAAARVTFTGGVQQERYTGSTRLFDYLTVTWPKQNVGGNLVAIAPDAARATLIVHAAARIGGSVQWLS